MANKTFEVDVRVGDRTFTVDLRAPEGISPELLRRQAIIEVRRKIAAEKAAFERDVGVFGVRPQVRRFMQERVPALGRFGAEVGGPTLGTILGAKAGLLGGPFAPVTVPAGAAAGGFLGEFLGQETGISPRSRTALVLSGAAPLALPAGALVKRAGVRALARSPLLRPAVRGLEAEKLIRPIGGLAGGVLPKVPSERLYAALDKLGAVVRLADFKNLRATTLDLLRKVPPELAAAFPEARSVRQLARRMLEFGPGRTQKIAAKPPSRVLLPSGQPAIPGQAARRVPIEEAPFSEIQDAVQLLGRTIGTLEKRGGVKLGTTRLFFRAFMDDLERIAVQAPPKRAGAALALFKRARTAFKAEKAAQTVDEIVTAATKAIPGEEGATRINILAILNRVRDLTNPKSRLFDKNFTAGLGGERDRIIAFLEKANNMLAAGQRFGPGELVIRGRAAKLGEKIATGAVSGLTFFLTSGGIAVSTLGALAGAKAPETIARLLLSPRGRRVLEALLRASTRRIPIRRLAGRGQVAGQTLLRLPLLLKGLEEFREGVSK